jgi:hypothetical protein
MQATPCERGADIIVHRKTADLHAHPSYVRHHLVVPSFKLSRLAEIGDLAFRDPILITPDGTIVDGYGRWELAKRQGRETVCCREYQLTADEALQCLVQSRSGSRGQSAFCRICLALDLEPALRERALANQRAGGQNKGLSKLAKADSLDVRSKIATIAGASPANVSKVKQLLSKAIPELLDALRMEGIRIHRAWKWMLLGPADQSQALWDYQNRRGIQQTIRSLISKHKTRPSYDPLTLQELCSRLSAIRPDLVRQIRIVATNTRGRVLTVSKELLQDLICQPLLPSVPEQKGSAQLQ